MGQAQPRADSRSRRLAVAALLLLGAGLFAIASTGPHLWLWIALLPADRMAMAWPPGGLTFSKEYSNLDIEIERSAQRTRRSEMEHTLELDAARWVKRVFDPVCIFSPPSIRF